MMSEMIRRAFGYLVLLSIASVAAPVLAGGGDGEAEDAQDRYFAVQVVDEETGRGVPLVELRTTNGIRYYTDSAGRVAIDEPGLVGRRVFFHVESHGYEFPEDGFGSRGKALKVERGASATLEIKRNNIAERLYRVTGQGIYNHSVRLGKATPLEKPVLNGQVTGQDSVQATVYRDRIHWFWGDTDRLSYPLGNFETSGATSALPADGGLDPSRGVNLRYFTNEDGFSRPMLPLEEEGVVWIDGLLTVKGPEGRERLLTHYTRLRGLGEPLGHGLAVYNDASDRFERLAKWPDDMPVYTNPGHPFRVTVDGEEYYYFANPYPLMRVKADWDHITDPTRYEAYTCLEPGSGFNASDPALERDGDGNLVYGWKRNTAPISPARQRELIDNGHAERDELWIRTRDVETEEPIELHGGTVHWNPYRQRWIMVAVEIGGASSLLGEVWYAEADSPEGPWPWAIKIASHDQYSFYNPAHHRFFDQDGGRLIYFEGTYVNSFSDTETPTPRYNYNQVMYRLDLSDADLAPLRQKLSAER